MVMSWFLSCDKCTQTYLLFLSSDEARGQVPLVAPPLCIGNEPLAIAQRQCVDIKGIHRVT